MCRCARQIHTQSAVYCWPSWFHSRRGFDQSIVGLLGNAIELEHILAHRDRVWIDRHRIKAYFNVSETHLDRRADVTVGRICFPFLGDADNAFRATSVERERSYTSSKQSDQNSMVSSLDKRQARAKLHVKQPKR